MPDAFEIVRRASEGGLFDDLLREWFDAPSFSDEEARAYEEIYFRAQDLLGGGPVPSIDLSRDGIQCRIGLREMEDHVRHGAGGLNFAAGRTRPIGDDR